MHEPAPGIVTRLRRGDTEALGTLFRVYGRRVYAVCRRILGNDADAEDATQQAFLRAFEKIGSYQGRSRLSAWLLRLAANHALNALESRRRRITEPLRADPVGNADPFAAAALRDDCARLDVVLQAMPPQQRAVLVLRERGGLTYAEIASALDIKVGTVMSRLSRARERLREELAANECDRRPASSRNTGGV